MKSQTRLLFAACALAAALAVTGCGNKSASVKSAKASKPVVEKKEAAKSSGKTPTAPAAGATGLASSNGLAEALNPLAGGSQPLAGVPGKPGAPAIPGAAPAAAPVKPIQANVRPQPKQLLLVLQQAYRGAASMKVQGISSTTVKIDGKVVGKQLSQRFVTTFKRPTKLILTSPDSTMTCDGKTVGIYSSRMKRYQKMPFDKKFVQGLVYGKPGVGMMGLLFGMDYTNAITSYKLLNDAKIAGQDTFVLQLKFKKGISAMPNANITQTLWIGKHDLAIYKNQVVAFEKPVRPKGLTGKFPKTIETTIVGTVTKFIPNPKISDSAFAFKPPAGAKPVEKPKAVNLIGKPAPDFSFTAPDGSHKKLSDLRGKPVMLVFYALPLPEGELKALQSAYANHSNDTQVVAVDLNPEREKVKQYMKSKGYSMPITFGDEAIARVAIEKYAIRGNPSMLMIDKSGDVRLATIGIPEGSDLTAKLNKYTPN